MTDRVTVYNKNGILLDELNIYVQREYRAERTIQVGRGSFTISADDPKATRANLQYNNIVVVESNLGIPIWAGLIWTPTVVKNNEIKITLRSIEWLLGQRTITFNSSGDPGKVFADMMAFGDYYTDTIISDDVSLIEYAGTYAEAWVDQQSVYDAANKLANDNGYYWGLRPIIPAIGEKLELRPYFIKKNGRTFEIPLIVGTTLMDVEVQEVGEIANRILVEARIDGQSEPVVSGAVDDISIGKYGDINAYLTNIVVRSAQAARDYAANQLKRRKQPFLRIAGTVKSLPFPLAGDLVPIDLNNSADYISRLAVFNCRVLNSVYDPKGDTLNILLEEDFGDESEIL